MKVFDERKEDAPEGADGREPDEVEDLEKGSPKGEDENVKKNKRTSSLHRKNLASRPGLIAALIILLGTAAFALILGFGITAARHDEQAHFEKHASDILHELEEAFYSYVGAGLWLHQACRTRAITHSEFRDAYEYLQSSGLKFRAFAFAMNVTSNAEREALENETRAYLEKTRPGSNYSGFIQFQASGEKGREPLVPRSNSSFYFPAHFMEPMEVVYPVVDVDLLTSPTRRKAINKALATWQPAMTTRMKLNGHNVVKTDPATYSVIIMHPGIPLPSRPEVIPRDLSVLAIQINDVFRLAHRLPLPAKQSISMYIFDSTETAEAPPFLGGAIRHGSWNTTGGLTFLPEAELVDLSGNAKLFMLTRQVTIASREWTFVAVASEDDFRPELVFVILVSHLLNLNP